MNFLVDQPLGGLAKWLRFCGFDATLMRLAPDKPGSWPPSQPQTHILTRQAACQRLKRPDLLVLAAPDPEGQLAEVIRRLRLAPRLFKPLSRCRHCNDPLAPLNRDQVQGRVSEHVFLHHRRFYECPRCHRVYWPGSHIQGITGTLRDQLNQLEQLGDRGDDPEN
ncbi:MAG: hypothetical protein FJ121_01940 [Deltaproteobacteria bacterium]|nr:hypothetical protein [Deltaproteobacteria bacterium]